MLEKSFLKYIQGKNLFSNSDTILLALSGGVDSMVMFELFRNENFNVGIAHCNFNLRGDESSQDAAFVGKVAKRYNLSYFEKQFDTYAYAEVNICSIQEAARLLRYQWFEKLCHDKSYNYFATAHHFDDQVETFFINLFRGTGVKGLRGIMPKNGICVRPLLFATRDEIMEYAVKHNVPYREDSSNQSHKYLRNSIRHNIIPAMAQVQPDYKTGFGKTFRLLKGTEKFIDIEIDRMRKLLFRVKEDRVYIALEKLKELSNLSFYIYELLKPFGFNEDTAENLALALDNGPGKVFYSKTHQLVIDRNELIITSIDKRKYEVYFIKSGQTKVDRPIKLEIGVLKNEVDSMIDPALEVAQLDLDKLKFPLQLRKWVEGDYYYPLGMNGRKKVSDYFIDEKFSLPDKRNTWLLLSGDDIVWIVGHRMDDRFKIVQQTKYILKITLMSPKL